MLICPICEKEYESEQEKCPECGGKLIKKSASKIIDVVGDVAETVIECVLDALT